MVAAMLPTPWAKAAGTRSTGGTLATLSVARAGTLALAGKTPMLSLYSLLL